MKVTLPAWLIRLRGQRGFVELGLVVVVGALVAGAVGGSGLAQTVLRTPDSLTWLGNRNGQVTRVNPNTGDAVDRMQIGGPGDELDVVQDENGTLVVINKKTGEVVFVDVSTLEITGNRPGAPESVKVLLAQGQVYLVDRTKGEVQRIDALTAATSGQPYRARGPLADAVADQVGTVWLLDRAGELTALGWSAGSGELVEQQRRTVDGAGGRAVLAGHERGVTVLDPSGTIAQIGTGQEFTATAPALTGSLVTAQSSPQTLVPVAAPQAGRLMLARRDRVVQVDTAAIGCRTPDRPAVYRGLVYLPCPGDRKVVVLNQDGQRAQRDITTPGAEPVLVPNAGLLFINVVDADTGLVVMPNGSTRTIRTNDPTLPVRDPDARPTALPPDPVAPPRNDPDEPEDDSAGPDQGADEGSQDDPAPGTGGPNPGPRPGTGGPPLPPRTSRPPLPLPTLPSPTLPGSPTPSQPTPSQPSLPVPTTTSPSPGPQPQDFTPTGVTAVASAAQTIQVSWTPAPIAPTSYRILRADNNQEVGTAAAGAAMTIISNVPLGQPMSFVVEAVTPSRSYQSAPSDPVAAFGLPAGPTVGVELVARAPASLTLRVTVNVVSDGGSPVSTYDFQVTNNNTGQVIGNVAGEPISQNPYQFEAPCRSIADLCVSGGTVTVDASLTNAAGRGAPAQVNSSIPGPPAWQYNSSNMIVTTGLKCLDIALNVNNCNESRGQEWSIRSTGEIRNPANGNACLATNGGLHFTTDGCTERPKRWDLSAGGGNTNQVIQNQDSDRCIFVNGPLDAVGVPFRDRRPCARDANEQFAFFVTSLPLSAPGSRPAVATRSAQVTDAAYRPAEHGLGLPLTALLLLPVAVGLVRRGRGRRAGRRSG